MLTVETLGRFRVRQGDAVLDDNNIHSVRLSNLLIYLILRRNQTTMPDEIADAVWQEGEVGNPAGALKNLMYRLRRLLEQYFGKQNYILSDRGSYRWNPEIEVQVDVEIFEKRYAKWKKLSEKKTEPLEQLLEAYTGTFLPKLAELYWVVARSAYYQSLYLSGVRALIQKYVEAEAYAKLELLCGHVLKTGEAEEDLYYYLIYAKLKQEKWKSAMETYETGTLRLKEELGISKTAKLDEIYEKLIRANASDMPDKMRKVKASMEETETEGVFFCGYPVFREIYRLEMRKAIRFQEKEAMLLLTMEPAGSGHRKWSQIDEFRIKNGMNRLGEVIKGSLRTGDVVSRYSRSQYVILLFSCSCEDGELVAERIVHRFYAENAKYSQLRIRKNLEKLNDEEEENENGKNQEENDRTAPVYCAGSL